MSRSWVEAWRVGVAADRVEVLRLRPFTRAQVVAQAEAPVDHGPAPQSDRVAAALDAALGAAGARRGRATVVLSNELVNFAVLPWQAEVTRPAEVQALARLHFERQLGAPAAGACTVRIHEGGWGHPVLACAVDSALVQVLIDTLAARGLKLTSLQPLLMAAANGLRKRLADDAALAIVEPARLTLARWRAGRPLEVASRHSAAAPAAVLAQELALSEAGPPEGAVDVLLVGPGARWQAGEAPATRLVAATPMALALAGVA